MKESRIIDGAGNSTEIFLSVLVPVYNEKPEALLKTIRELKERLDVTDHSYEIIIIDDGSTSSCRSILGPEFAESELVFILRNPYNLGYSASLKRGLKKARGEYILTTDADGSYPAAAIPELLTYVDEYDMVVGSRTGENVNIPLLRRPVKTLIRWLAIFLSGRHIPDLNSGLRIFRKELAMEFYHLFPSRFSFTITLTLASLTNDYTIRYVPIDYLKRIGKSSIRPIHDTIEFFFLIFRIIMYFKPLRFFIIPAFFLLLIGFSYLLWGIIIKEDILDGAIMLLVVGSQVLFTGFLADIITKQKLNR